MHKTVNQAIKETVEAGRTWPERLKSAQAEGSRLVGYTGRFVPAELIRAAGAKPYAICRGGEGEAVEAVLPYMLQFLNPYARAQIGYHMLGLDPVMPMLDLVLAQCDDCHMVRLADMFEFMKLPTFRVGVPPDWKKEISREYYLASLMKAKARLEELAGQAVSETSLKAAVESANTVRRELSRLDSLREDDPPVISGLDFIRLNHAAFYWEPDPFAEKLAQIHDAAGETHLPAASDAPRLLLAGHVVAMGDYTVPRLVESCGGRIVAEFLDEGMQHHDRQVSTEGDLMQNLADAYFSGRVPPSIFQPAWAERRAALMERIRQRRVDGVIWYQLAFDEIYNLEYAVVAKALAEAGIPLIKLESSYEYAREAMGPLTTRIESFIDSLKAGRASS
jgi:benzoyl-CoA reductase/2-hydroxyglutaryl-CoA dehydratase subunit BcrC/BadD/HgdB